MVNNLPAGQEIQVGKIPWRRERLPTPVFEVFSMNTAYVPLKLCLSVNINQQRIPFVITCTKRIKKTVPPLDSELLKSFRLLIRLVLPPPFFILKMQFLFNCPN